ncbi:MAG: ATP-binding protein, partial [Myxococcota bacterium]
DLPPKSEARNDLLDIKRASMRAARLIDQLLLFSRQRADAVGTANLNAVIKQVERMVLRVLGETIRVQLDLAGDLWDVGADPSQLDQIVMNLVLNARDAMPDGGELRISTSNVILDAEEVGTYLGDPASGAHVLLEVADTGSGIEPELHDRVFEPFFTTKPSGKGTGLGLAMVFAVTKRFGGGVQMTSALGQGTTFRIVLPRAAQTAPVAQSELPRDRLEAAQATVLVVEDDDTIRNVVSRMLSRFGYRVLTAAHPAVALTIAHGADKIDLLLSDVVMPEMNGFVLADLFRQEHPEAKVLFMSGYSDQERAARGLAKDSIELLPKPFTVQELLERVHAVLGDS